MFTFGTGDEGPTLADASINTGTLPPSGGLEIMDHAFGRLTPSRGKAAILICFLSQ